MNPANREKVKELLSRAARLPGQERIAFIRRECGDDAQTAAEAIDLLATLDDPEFMSAPTGVGLAAALPGSAIPGEKPGTRVDRYKLLQLIGEGGFGSVYMAEQFEPVHRRVALKIIKAGMDTKQVIARFEAERQALAMMDHPNIARVLDAGSTQAGRPYFVMELVRGEPVTTYCDDHRLSIRERLEIFKDVCHAVQHAHQKGIIHRDLKPSNVLVTIADGKPLPKVIDFGIAKATGARLTDKTLFTEIHQLVGTPEYMSPEQAEVAGVDIDTRSDVYSLGVLLYELLAGTTPLLRERLRATPLAEIQRLIREEDPPRPSIRLATMASTPSRHTPLNINDSSALDIARSRQEEPATLTRTLRGDLDWIVMKCLEKDRSRRYASAVVLADDVDRYLADEPVLATPPSRVYAARKFVRRNRGVVAAGCAIAATLAIAAVVSLAFAISANRQRRVAESALTRAETAESGAKDRAAELEQVAKFQQAQLSGIDVQAMGARLRVALFEKTRSAAERSKLPREDIDARVAELEKLISGSDFTGLALEALDDNVFQPALAAIEGQFDDQPLVQARLLQTLASTLGELGLFDAASGPQAEALAIRRETLGDEHPDTLSSIHEMGALLHERGKLSEAETYYREALEKRRRLLGEQHPDTLASINSMGNLLQAQGKLDEAKLYWDEALEKRRRVLGDDHPDTLQSIQNMGFLLRAQGKLDQAEPYYRAALEKLRLVRGEEHRDTLTAIGNLGYLLQVRGKLDEAELYQREALEKRRRVLGEQHPDTLASISTMGDLFQAQGKLDEAKVYWDEALAKYRRVLGDEHPNTLISISNMGFLLQAQGKLDEAKPYWREVLEKNRRLLGDDHPSTLRSIYNMGFLLQAQGKLDEAEPYYREALEKRRRVLGDEHPDTLISIQNMGLLLRAQGKLDQAEPYYREALTKRRRVLGDEHPHTLASIGSMGDLLRAQGQPTQAIELLLPAEPAARRAWSGDNAVRLGRFLTALGRSRAATGEFEAAEANLIEAYAIVLEAKAATAQDRTEVPTGLAELYDAWHAVEPTAGHDAKAAEWRARLLEEPSRP